MEENLPPGFRFHPTDEELITFYLSKKVCDISFSSKAIADVDLNKCEPWDLPEKGSMGVKEWYFFSLRDRKYPTGLRTNRATDAGYWKTTGKDKQIFGTESELLLIGMKKTLVFYFGRAPKGEKTNWVMHEYRLTNNNKPYLIQPTKDEWVVCRVFQKNVVLKKSQSTLSASQVSPDSPDDTNTNLNTNTNEFGDINANFSYPLLQTYSNCDNNLNINGNTSLTLNNWATNIPNYPSIMSWPSTLLSTNLNNTVNSLLLKALQFTSNSCTSSSTYFQPRDATNTDYSFLDGNQQKLPPLESSSYLGFQLSSGADKLFDLYIPPQQNEVNQLQVQDQTFLLDSMW